MSNEMETRTVNSPRTGTKVSLIIAASALAAAVYFFTVPTHFMGKDGGVFGCGSPMSPNNNALGKSQCHLIENENLHKAILFLALALIIAILGGLLFGMEKSVQHRGARSRLDDESEDDGGHDDEDGSHRRSGLLSGRSERSERGERASRGRHEGSRRPRLGDEDEMDHDDEDRRVDEPRRSRGATHEVGDSAEPTSRREARRGSRYDADAFDKLPD